MVTGSVGNYLTGGLSETEHFDTIEMDKGIIRYIQSFSYHLLVLRAYGSTGLQVILVCKSEHYLRPVVQCLYLWIGG